MPLLAGGLITNYHCTSACAHCLYYSSPKRSHNYIDYETTRRILQTLKTKGCQSLHIGGGEPFLNFTELVKVIQAFNESQVSIQYIETNAAWFNNDNTSFEKLENIKELGVERLLVSISPFHNHTIPLQKTLALCDAAFSKGISVFPWIDDFISDLQHMGPESTHKLREFQMAFGSNYIRNIPNRYGISFRGRALKTYNKYMPKYSLTDIFEYFPGPCKELFSTSHFHVDLHGNYVPGLCPGLSLDFFKLPVTLPQDDYPFLSLLATRGIAAFYTKVKEEFHYQSKDHYKSKCELCENLRFHLYQQKAESNDLKPAGFYEQMNIEDSFDPFS